MTATNDHDLAAAVAADVLRQVRASAAWDEAQARRVRDWSADALEIAAAIKREIADILAGAPVTADRVAEAGPLGMRVGPLPLLPPPDSAPLGDLEMHRRLLERVYEVALRQMQATSAEITRRRLTMNTVRLAPEDIPGPDPLTAHPAEESGAHRVMAARTGPAPQPAPQPAPEPAHQADPDETAGYPVEPAVRPVSRPGPVAAAAVHDPVAPAAADGEDEAAGDGRV